MILCGNCCEREETINVSYVVLCRRWSVVPSMEISLKSLSRLTAHAVPITRRETRQQKQHIIPKESRHSWTTHATPANRPK